MVSRVDELLLEDDRINAETATLYQSLGLMTLQSSNSLKIFSTNTTSIIAFSDGIYLSINSSYCKTLLKNGIISKMQDSFYTLNDNINTKIYIKATKKANKIKIGILTSGGDAPGMNSAVRSVIRKSLKNDIPVFGIYRGYEGLIRGDIRKLNWDSETQESGSGGTSLLSMRCKKFRTREGRKEAAYNLFIRGINNLVILGGDGSLTGAMKLKEEFKDLCKEIIEEGLLKTFIQIRKNSKNMTFEQTRAELLKNSKEILKHVIYPGSHTCKTNKTSSKKDKNDNFDLSNLKAEANNNIRSNKNSFKDDKNEDSHEWIEHAVEDRNECSSESENLNEKAEHSLSMEDITDLISDTWDDESLEDLESLGCELYDLNIVGIPSTIDNDLACTELTLGADSALHRICEVVNKVSTTMRSHRIIFVFELMGNHCGWLTIMAAFASNVDYVFIPEAPVENWKDDMMAVIRTAFYNHKTNIFVFKCENSKDGKGNLIGTDEITKFIKSQGMDTRSLRLGHIQRGGTTSAMDRYIGTLSGIKAVEYIMTGNNESKLVGFVGGECALIDLGLVVKETTKVNEYFEKSDYEGVLRARGPLFNYVFALINEHRKIKVEKYYKEHLYCNEERIARFKRINERRAKIDDICIDKLCCVDIKSMMSKGNKTRIAILNDGIRVPGMNSVLNVIVQYGICQDFEVFYFIDGYDGIELSQVQRAYIFEFSSRFNDGGSAIGSSKVKNHNIEFLKKKLKEMNIDYLIVVGGGRNLQIAKEIENTILIPASSENNVPATYKSVGCDTSLNLIVAASDACKMSAYSMSETIFVVQVGGDDCGYLSIIGGIAAGAFEVLYPENCPIEQLVSIKKRLNDVFKRQKRKSIVIIRNENTHGKMNIESLCSVLSADTKFCTYFSVLGHLQKGISPSPADIITANLLAIEALNCVKNKTGSGVVGIESVNYKPTFTKIEDALSEYDHEKDKVKGPKWLKLADICSSLE